MTSQKLSRQANTSMTRKQTQARQASKPTQARQASKPAPSGIVKPISVRCRQPILIFCNRWTFFYRYWFWCLPISPISVKNICLYRWKKFINIGHWPFRYRLIVITDIVYITITDFTDIRWYRYTNIGHQYRLVSMTDIAYIPIPILTDKWWYRLLISVTSIG